MSERKSWDIQPQRKQAQAPRLVQAQPVPPRAVQRPKAAPVEKKSAPVAAQSVQRIKPQPLGALKQRRARKRKVVRYVVLSLCVAALALVAYLVWMPAFRITHVEANGPASEQAAQIARDQMKGTYWYVVPRNSVFLIPQSAIREQILAADPDVSAVSLSRVTFSSLIIQTTPRATSFIWCGTAIDVPFPDGTCYDADIEGLIFKQADVSSATTTATSTAVQLGDIRIFGALDAELSSGETPVGHRMQAAHTIPDALKFVKAVRDLGAPVSSLAIRGDEADLWINGPTRITYVLGDEISAASLAASVLPTLNLTNASIKYVDLRFPGKAYISKYGE